MSNTTTTPVQTVPVSSYDIGYFVMCGITLLTNTLGLIILISGRRRLKGPSYIILTSSFVSCILVAFLYEIGMRLIYLRTPFLYVRGILCNFGGSGGMALMTNINLHLCLISAERYIFVMYPFNYHKIISRCNVAIALVAAWTLPLFVMMGPFFYRELSLTRCTFEIFHKRQIIINDAISYSAMLSLLYFIPLCTIVTVYVRIYILIQTHGASQLQSQRQQEVENKKRDPGRASTKNVKAIRQMVILIGVFFICWTPFAVCSVTLLWLSAYANLTLVPVIENVAWAVFVLRYLAYCYPLLHPVLYCYFNAHIKIEVMRIFYKSIGKEEAYRRFLHSKNGTTSFYVERKSTTVM